MNSFRCLSGQSQAAKFRVASSRWKKETSSELTINPPEYHGAFGSIKTASDSGFALVINKRNAQPNVPGEKQ